MNFIFPTKYVIPKSLSRLAIGQVSIWLSFFRSSKFYTRKTIDQKVRWGDTTLDGWFRNPIPNHRLDGAETRRKL